MVYAGLTRQKEAAMTLDLDAFLTALYTIVDDLYKRYYVCRNRFVPQAP